MRDDDDRPRDASSAAEPDWSNLVVPDDLRDLAADVAAYRRELRRARRPRLARMFDGGLFDGRRSRAPMLALIAASLLAGLIAVMLTVMAPRAVEPPPAASPLATPTAAVGTLHGLLPDAALRGPNGLVDARSATLRPAVFALVPAGCSCRTLLNGLAGAAFSERLPLAVVVPAASDPGTATVVNSLDRGVSALYLDPSGALALGVSGALPDAGGQTATVVVVNRDGTIYDIETGVADAAATTLDATLQSMLIGE